MSKSTSDRRAHVRFPRTFALEGAKEPGGTVARMVASDLSLGGLYCSSSTDFPEMTRLAVRLLLPKPNPSGTNGADSVDVEAVVVRRTESCSVSGNGRYELALYFTGMSESCRAKLARFLARTS